METHDLKPYIAEHPFFEGLAPEYIELIAGCAKNVVFEAGSYVFKQATTAEWFYVLRDGHAVVEVPSGRGSSLRVSTLGAGDILGWSWLIPPYVYQFDARAVEKTRAVALDGECLRGKCETDSDLGYELMKRFSTVMTTRLQEARLQLIDMYSTSPDGEATND